MKSEATRARETIGGGEVLYMALELSARSWKVLFRLALRQAAGAERRWARSGAQ